MKKSATTSGEVGYDMGDNGEMYPGLLKLFIKSVFNQLFFSLFYVSPNKPTYESIL